MTGASTVLKNSDPPPYFSQPTPPFYFMTSPLCFRGGGILEPPSPTFSGKIQGAPNYRNWGPKCLFSPKDTVCLQVALAYC